MLSISAVVLIAASLVDAGAVCRPMISSHELSSAKYTTSVSPIAAWTAWEPVAESTSTTVSIATSISTAISSPTVTDITSTSTISDITTNSSTVTTDTMTITTTDETSTTTDTTGTVTTTDTTTTSAATTTTTAATTTTATTLTTLITTTTTTSSTPSPSSACERAAANGPLMPSGQFCGGCTYDISCGTIATGNSFPQDDIATLADCAAFCDENDDCLGIEFDFNAGSNGCTLYADNVPITTATGTNAISLRTNCPNTDCSDGSP